jgi:hypothetical protein
MYSLVNFKDGGLFVDGKPVKNHFTLLEWMKGAILRNNEKEIASRFYSDGHTTQKSGFTYTLTDMLTNPNLRMVICPLHYVTDGDFAFVCGFDLWRNIPISNCHCGVPLDVHGACCGWQNAKHICDDTLSIVDSRHPFYKRNLNEWINRAVGV